MKRIAQVLFGLWLLSGMARLLLMPFIEPDRLGFHLVGGAIQVAIAGFLLRWVTYRDTD